MQLTILHFDPLLHVDRVIAILHLNVFVLCANQWNSVWVLAGTLECMRTPRIWHGKVFLISTVRTVCYSIVGAIKVQCIALYT